MRIAVLSDTHDHLPNHLCDAFAGASEIWHLGDVSHPSIIATLESIAPVRVVQGNCDEYPWPIFLDVKLFNFRFHLEHIPAKDAPLCDVFLHGHTHVPRDEIIGGIRFLNPGCISRPKAGITSFAWLSVSESTLQWEITPFARS